MKRAVGWALAWVLYWAGHLVSLFNRRFDRLSSYRLYSALMIASLDVQKWGGDSGPWGPPGKEYSA